MDLFLEAPEIRVLGSLLEKESTTPEYYPLTLNALVAACNQKSNREPIVAYDEETVSHALELLKAKRFAAMILGNGRVSKYAQRFTETLNLGRREAAVLCTLMLRGPQTLSEVRDRSERMHRFEETTEVEACIERLADSGMAVRLPKQPGQKEARYTHLLAGEVPSEAIADRPPQPLAARDRLSALELEVADLREQVRKLQDQISQFL